MTTQSQGFNQNSAGVDITAGNRVGLPAGMTVDKAIIYLEDFRKEQAKKVNHRRVFEGYAWQDVAVQLTRALRETFGWASGKPTAGLFGDETPPSTMRISTAWGVHEEVLWHTEFHLQAWDNATGLITPYYPDEMNHPEYFVAAIQFTSRQKDAGKVAILFDLVDRFLLEQSIYRGQAVTTDLDFIEPGSLIQPSDLVFNHQTMFDMQASIFLPIQQREKMQALGMDAKRGVLLAGPYGTGKTMTAMAAAHEAIEHGWTFLYIDSGNAQHLGQWLEWAVIYGPAVVFMEDVDTLTSGDRDQRTNEMLNTMDGLTTKGQSILTILTTNHVENIHPAMLRPGRLDALIVLDLPDVPTRAAILQHYATAEPLTDFIAAAEACEDGGGNGYPGAALREVAERATRYAMLEGRALVNTDDLIGVAGSMRAHIDLTRDKPKEKTPSLDFAFREVVKEANRKK
jgi:transitional endoplasmic reticulum ATPase